MIPRLLSARAFNLIALAAVACSSVTSALADPSPRFEPITSFVRSPEHPSRAGILNHPTGVFATASEGGDYNGGTLFKVNGSSLTHVVHFSGMVPPAKGSAPSGAMVTDATNAIWGVTTRGGADNAGTVYRFNPSSGGLQTKLEFGALPHYLTAGELGRNPTLGLTRDGNGQLWGISGGIPAMIYKIDPGTEQVKVVARISPDKEAKLGTTPSGELTFDGVDSLWGATTDGGSGGNGRVYKVHQTTGAVTVMATFTGTTPSPTAGKAARGAPALEGATGSMLCVFSTTSTSRRYVLRINIGTGSLSLAGDIVTDLYNSTIKEGLVDMGNGYFGGISDSSNGYYGCLFQWKPGTPQSNPYQPGPSETRVQLFPYGGRLTAGAEPVALISTGTGILTGTTAEGGMADKGAVFSFSGTSIGPFIPLAGESMERELGSNPSGGLYQGAEGRLVGLNKGGGMFWGGTAYAFNPIDDQVTNVASFRADGTTGRGPVGELVCKDDFAGRHLLYAQTTSGSSGFNTGLIVQFMDKPGLSPHQRPVIQVQSNVVPDAGLTLSDTYRLWGAADNRVYSMRPDSTNPADLRTEFTLTGKAGPYFGSQVTSRLYKDSTGILWGTTAAGGVADHGTIYKIDDRVPTFTTVIQFTDSGGGVPGSRPNGPLVEDGAGNLWGTTAAGGTGGKGTVFKLQTSHGVLSTMASFGGGPHQAAGATPLTGLTSDGRGYLWGSTSAGGESGLGTLYRIDTGTGVLETMFQFTGSNPAVPGGAPATPLLLHSDGNLYGTTPGLAQNIPSGAPGMGGNVFRIRFGQKMAVALAGRDLVDGVPVPHPQDSNLLLNVYDVEDSRLLQFTVTNRGTTPLTQFSGQIAGAQAADFTLLSTVPDTLQPGQTIEVEVKFDPQAAGNRNAVLTFGASSPEADAFVVPLNGICLRRAVGFAITGYTILEDNYPSAVVVQLSSPLSVPLKVPFTVSKNGASSADFSVSSSPLVIPAGATTGTIWVTCKKDYLVESNESITLTLGKPAHGFVDLTSNVDYRTCTVEFANDDEVPTLDSAGMGGVLNLGDPFEVGSNHSNPTGMAFTGTWRHNGKVIPGARQPVYRAHRTTAAHAGTYQYSMRTASGDTVTGAPFYIWVIDHRTQALAIVPGKNALLTFVAAGRDLTFKWRRIVNEDSVPVIDGGRISGATSNALRISQATPADAGTYYCEYALEGFGTNEVEFVLSVPTVAPDALLPEFPAGQVALNYEYQLPRNGGEASRVAVTGLPAGLVCNSVTGLITGRPTQSGRFKINVTMSNQEGKDSTSAFLEVAGLPDFLPGKHTAWLSTDQGIGSRLDLTVAESGTVTGFLTSGTQRRQLSSHVALSNDAEAACRIELAGSNSSTLAHWVLDLTFISEHLMGGEFSTRNAFGENYGSVIGWHQSWNATTRPANHLQRYHTFVLKDDEKLPGHGSISLGLDGTTVIAAKMADGSSVTTSSFLAPDNRFMVYQSLYDQQGGVRMIGQLVPPSESGQPDLIDEVASCYWRIPRLPATSRYAKNPAFNNVTYHLIPQGCSYQKPAAGACLLGLNVVPAGTSNAQFEFGIDSSIVPAPPNIGFRLDTDHRAVLPAVNPGRIRDVVFNASTGAFSGAFTLDYGTARARTATFSGMLIPSVNQGLGFFTIPDVANPLTVPAVTVKNSAMQLGTVTVKTYTAPSAP